MSAAAPVAPVAPVVVPTSSWRSEVRAVRAVWWRDLLRFRADPTSIVTWLLQPLMFLFILGPGLQSLSERSTDGIDLVTFMFPGTVCMALLYAGMFSAATLVWDRELGFLREMVVAPVRRSSIVVGKCLGGASIAVSQGLIMVALGGLVGVPYDPLLLLGMLGLVLLVAVTVTAFGIMVGVTIQQARTFTSVMQLFVFPMMFLSGALYPITDLPLPLRLLNRINPLTYAVDPMRRLVFHHLDAPVAARHRLAPGITWWGWSVPPWLEVLIVLAIGASMLTLAVVRFSRTE